MPNCWAVSVKGREKQAYEPAPDDHLRISGNGNPILENAPPRQLIEWQNLLPFYPENRALSPVRNFLAGKLLSVDSLQKLSETARGKGIERGKFLMNKSFTSPDFQALPGVAGHVNLPTPVADRSPQYVIFKTIFDKGSAVIVLPLVALIALLLLALNPFFNPGPLFYRQNRMGLGGRRFRMWKFRTMTQNTGGVRDHDAPLEEERITPLGRFLRRSRIDELPNFINVLRGDMSVIGPRPDAWEHAIVHIGTIPRYGHRFRVRPGITGLAQIRGGYADSKRAIERKARLDLFYVRNARTGLDLYVALCTVRVIVTGFGAR